MTRYCYRDKDRECSSECRAWEPRLNDCGMKMTTAIRLAEEKGRE
jgi:hypothetical protein